MYVTTNSLAVCKVLPFFANSLQMNLTQVFSISLMLSRMLRILLKGHPKINHFLHLKVLRTSFL